MSHFNPLLVTRYLIVFLTLFLVRTGYSQEVKDLLEVPFSKLNGSGTSLGTITNSNNIQPEFQFKISEPGNKVDFIKRNIRLRVEGETSNNAPNENLIIDFRSRMAGGTQLRHVEVVDISTNPHKVVGHFDAVLNTGDDTNATGTSESFSDTDIQIAAQEKLDEIIASERYTNENGVLIKNNVVHLFIDQTGKLYGNSIPTAATEDQYFQLHLLYEKGDVDKYRYRFNYSGTYTPTFNIYGTPTVEKGAEGTAAGAERTPEIGRLDYAVIGKFTSQFNIQLIRENTTGERNTTTLLSSTIPIAKKYHVSLTTGLVASFLKNPENIRASTLPDGNTTLIADDPNSRGMFTLMAVYYPRPRYFLHDNKGLLNKESFGIAVGTRIDKDQFENLFVGLQSDFARGGSVIAGIHYGRQNAVAGYENFEFGKDIYTGPTIENNIIQQWKANFFIGVNIDLRVVRHFLANTSPQP